MSRRLILAVTSVWAAFSGPSLAPAAETTIEALATNTWQPNAANAAVGDAVVWRMGAGDPGTHGVRITNWAAVRDHVEVETVEGQQPFDADAGRNPNSTDEPGRVLLRLRLKAAPPAPAQIRYNCIVHGAIMSGTVTVAAAPVPPPEPPPAAPYKGTGTGQ